MKVVRSRSTLSLAPLGSGERSSCGARQPEQVLSGRRRGRREGLRQAGAAERKAQRRAMKRVDMGAGQGKPSETAATVEMTSPSSVRIGFPLAQPAPPDESYLSLVARCPRRGSVWGGQTITELQACQRRLALALGLCEDNKLLSRWDTRAHCRTTRTEREREREHFCLPRPVRQRQLISHCGTGVWTTTCWFGCAAGRCAESRVTSLTVRSGTILPLSLCVSLSVSLRAHALTYCVCS